MSGRRRLRNPRISKRSFVGRNQSGIGCYLQGSPADYLLCSTWLAVLQSARTYLATLRPTRALKLLDLTELLLQEDADEFESLDLAVHMLFYAPEHSYPSSRAIAIAAMTSGFDGIVYPSYFSQVRSGLMPAETIGYGISIRNAARHFPRLAGRAKSGVYPNVALFGRPIRDGLVEIDCVNRLILYKASYDIRFGPVITH